MVGHDFANPPLGNSRGYQLIAVRAPYSRLPSRQQRMDEILMKTFEGFNSTLTKKGVATSLMAGVVFFMTGCASIPPPTDRLAVTKAAIADASASGANEFAPVELKSAMDKLGEAERAMADKEYVQAKRLAEEAELAAKLAETKTHTAKAQKAVDNAKESNRILREELQRAAPAAQSAPSAP